MQREPVERAAAPRARSRRLAGHVAAAVCAAAAAAPASAQPPTAELTGYLTVATDVRNRGLSQLDGTTAVRAGIDYQRAGGLFAGAVAGNVGYAVEAAPQRPRENLLELYAGYLWRRTDWSFAATLGHYRYPGAAVDYDYSEISTVVELRDRYFYRFSYTDDLMSVGNAAVSHEVGLNVALPADLELGVALGRSETRGGYPIEYTHYNFGISRLVGRFGLDLRRYDTSREIVSYFGSSAADRWVLSLSYSIRPRP